MALDVAALSSCTRCRLSATRTRVVIGTGPNDAVLLLVGEAPGRQEDEGGAPFIGRSGQLLFTLIEEEVGLSREQCYVTNTVKCRPPANRTPARDELEACRPWLEAQLAELAPRVTLALGLTAAREVLGATLSMSAVHGRARHLGDATGIATYHPAAALRDPALVAVMRADLRVVRTFLEAS